MPSRRAFLGVAAAATGLGRGAWAEGPEPTWLSYALDVETFWRGLPILDRLKKVAEAGFNAYEFRGFKAKDVPAIAEASRALDLAASRFTAYRGIADPSRKDAFLEAFDDAIGAAEDLGAKRLGVEPGEAVAGLDRAAMLIAVADALKDAAEKAEEHDITILIEPTAPKVGRARPLVATVADAAEVVDAVGSPRVKIDFDLRRSDPGAIEAHFGKVGHFRLDAPPDATDAPRALRLIRDLGYRDAVAVALAPGGDPSPALDRLRLADAAAKAR